ncbi:hypothetical protein EJP67_32955 [Variovorax guangxiensis]|uniref:Uncharacterized protein n=1 Tax=Variovorax guangxiensis TaxID=1775474 RepID=A0A3S1A7Z7_9BURK|nr:hypothetical protein [Variovorax guangxiensis]RUR71867.1 hypothetical protein EJP67_32955 [Variovorax guangxiensis]
MTVNDARAVPKSKLVFTELQHPANGQAVHFWTFAMVDRDPDSFGVRGRYENDLFRSQNDSLHWAPEVVFVWRAVDTQAESKAIIAVKAAVLALSQAAELCERAGVDVPVQVHIENALHEAQRGLTRGTDQAFGDFQGNNNRAQS